MVICNTLNLTWVFFKGDCKAVVNAVNLKELSLSVMYPIVYDIQVLLHNHPHWRVQINQRNSNKVAHNLAKLACTMQKNSIWLGEFPMQIRSCVIDDMPRNSSS